MSNSWITPYGGRRPRIHPDAFVDISARIIGDVRVEEGASIWPMAVLRATDAEIYIGQRAAILDLAFIEAPKGYPVRVEGEVLISHGAIIHGAQIQSHSLVGIGAIVLEGVVICRGSVIGAGAVIPPGTTIPPNSLVLGVPGRVVRETTPEERQGILVQLRDLHLKSRKLMASMGRSSPVESEGDEADSENREDEEAKGDGP